MRCPLTRYDVGALNTWVHIPATDPGRQTIATNETEWTTMMHIIQERFQRNGLHHDPADDGSTVRKKVKRWSMMPEKLKIGGIKCWCAGKKRKSNTGKSGNGWSKQISLITKKRNGEARKSVTCRKAGATCFPTWRDLKGRSNPRVKDTLQEHFSQERVRKAPSYWELGADVLVRLPSPVPPRSRHDVSVEALRRREDGAQRTLQEVAELDVLEKLLDDQGWSGSVREHINKVAELSDKEKRTKQVQDRNERARG